MEHKEGQKQISVEPWCKHTGAAAVGEKAHFRDEATLKSEEIKSVQLQL